MTLDELIARIGPLDDGAMQAAASRQDVLTKPRGSLGRLEELSIRVAGMMGDALPRLQHKAVLVMAGDLLVVIDDQYSTLHRRDSPQAGKR